MKGTARPSKIIILTATLGSLAMLIAPGTVSARHKKKKVSGPEGRMEAYRQATRQMPTPTPVSLGSLWVPGGAFTDIAADYKARHVNDLITVRIAEQTVAQAQGTVKSQRAVSANSGIAGLLGQVGPRSGLQTLFSPGSQQNLNGQAQTASTSNLQASLAGRVVEVLPSGVLRIEAGREIEMNNQRETVVVRGLVRPGDILPDNSVLSTSIADLEVELKGKGVISSGTRPFNPLIRKLLWLIGF